MASITLPPVVADDDTIEPLTWGNVVRTALDRLPKGIVAETNAQTLTTVLASAIGVAETLVNIASPAVATVAGRQYRGQFQFQLRNAQALTSFATLRVRRTNLAGAVVLGPVEISKKAGTASRDLITVTFTDSPGTQAAQVWAITLQTDAATVDVYRPLLIQIEDMGAT